MSTLSCMPAARSACSSALLFCRFRIVANTRQPREARTTAVASPIPLEVPVISTDRMNVESDLLALSVSGIHFAT